VIAARRVDARLHLPPERLCPAVVLVADFAEPANLRGCRSPLFAALEKPLRTRDSRHMRPDREQAAVNEFEREEA
jgi:hypothetical protein